MDFYLKFNMDTSFTRLKNYSRNRSEKKTRA